MKKEHSGNLAHEDFSGKNLEGHLFEKCILDDVSFKHANLTGARFNNCQGEGLLFTEACLKGAKIENCSFTFSDFEHVNLREAKIVTLDLSYSALTDCVFNRSSIDNLTVSGCEMNMASFIDVQMKSVKYTPALPMGSMRGIDLFVPGKMRHNQVFINGNEHLAFAGYCRHESTVERLFSRVEEDRCWARRPFKVAGLWLFYVISDFGQSFIKWLGFLLLIVLLFAAVFWLHLGICPLQSLNISLHAFCSLDLDRITEITSWLFLAESITGYFMLGVLVSMLTNKIISA